MGLYILFGAVVLGILCACFGSVPLCVVLMCDIVYLCVLCAVRCVVIVCVVFLCSCLSALFSFVVSSRLCVVSIFC